MILTILTSIVMIYAEFPAEKASLLALTGKLLMVVVCVCACVCVRVRARLRHRTVPMESAAAAGSAVHRAPVDPERWRHFCEKLLFCAPVGRSLSPFFYRARSR